MKGITSEIIEAYVNGKLSSRDSSWIEAEMAKDPAIRNEVAIQRDIANAVQNYRKHQLKSRLNNISVGPSGTGLSALKIAAGILIAAMSGAGIYLLSTDDTSVEQEKALVQQENTYKEEEVKETSTEEVAAFRENLITEETEQESKPTIIEEQKPAPIEPAIKTEPKKVPKRTTPTMPMMSNSEQGPVSISTPEEIQGMPTDDIGNNEGDLNINIERDNKKLFHYTLMNNRLILYGDFSSRYNIKSMGPSEYYMLYEGDIYKLSPVSEKQELQPLKDKDEVKRLSTQLFKK